MRCTGVFAVAEHELKLLTAGDGTRSSVRDVKREVAAVRGEVEGLADTLSELRSEMASMRNQLTRRHEAMREKLLAEIQAELRQGRGGLRQVIDRMVMGMDIQVDLDAVRTAAQEWNTSFQAETESRVHAAMESAQAILTNHAMVAVADAHALQGGASNSPIARQSLRGIDSRLGKIEKQWNEERRVILRKLQSLDAAHQDTVAASANAATETAAATAAAVARAVVKETAYVPQEGVPPRVEAGGTAGTSIVPPAVSTRLDSLEAAVSAMRRDNDDIQSYMEGLSTQTRGFILLQKLMLRKYSTVAATAGYNTLCFLVLSSPLYLIIAEMKIARPPLVDVGWNQNSDSFFWFVARDASDPDTLELFNAMDVDGDGKVSPIEMLQGLQMIGEQDVTQAEVAQIFALLDEDDDGTLDYSEISRVGQLNEELKSVSRRTATLDAYVKSIRQQLDNPHYQQQDERRPPLALVEQEPAAATSTAPIDFMASTSSTSPVGTFSRQQNVVEHASPGK